MATAVVTTHPPQSILVVEEEPDVSRLLKRIFADGPPRRLPGASRQRVGRSGRNGSSQRANGERPADQTRGAAPRILSANSGARALQIAARTPLDLVILDIKLPDITGTEVLRRLRSLDSNVPVLMATSHGSVVTVRTAMELGAFDYLTKPLDKNEFECAVFEAIASRAVTPLRLGA